MEGENDGGEDKQNEEQDPAKALLQTQLSDFEYLYNMALIKLSLEEKEKLLKERDDKINELKDLQTKFWYDLWNNDLDNFLVELEVNILLHIKYF